MYRLFTSESVCAGHPDKICDQISDAIVDEALRQDPKSKTGVEAAVKDRIILIGEINSKAKIDYKKIVKKVVKDLGYTIKDWGFYDGSSIEVHINQQSPEIYQGVEDDEGAGDQGMMFGFACNETKNMMPMPITLAHEITERIDKAREDKSLAYLRPDGKSQVTVRYEKGKPVAVDKVVVAVAHDEDVKLHDVSHDIYEKIVTPALKAHKLSVDKGALVVNGTGVWHMPGPASDAGVTGRKIIVDGYGGYARVGGGAFSGKDPSKVDRSAAYAARYLAKNVVAAGMADKVEVALAYAIGIARPVMQTVETFGTEKKSLKEIEQYMHELLDTSVKGIVEGLDLRRPIYQPTAAYGHFGRNGFSWEKISN